MGLFDILKKKTKVENIVKEDKKIKEYFVESKRIEIKGKYDFLNNIEYLELFNGLPDKEIKVYSQEFKTKFNVELPQDVREFLKITNGAYLNGIRFYSKFNDEIKKYPRLTKNTVDIIGYNENYRMMTDIEDYIMLGKDSISFFVYSIENKKYYVLDNCLLDKMNEYNDFSTMVKEVLEGKIYE